MSHFVPIQVIIDQEGRCLSSLNEPGMPTIHVKHKYKYKQQMQIQIQIQTQIQIHTICVIFNDCSSGIQTNSVPFVGNIINVLRRKGIQIMTRFCSRSMHIFHFRMISRYEQQMMHELHRKEIVLDRVHHNQHSFYNSAHIYV